MRKDPKGTQKLLFRAKRLDESAYLVSIDHLHEGQPEHGKEICL